MHSEAGEASKMKAHHVPLRQIVEERVRRGVHDESERSEGEV